MQFSTSLVMIGIFFNKRRSIANGLVMSGGSIGQLIMPVLFNHLVETYSFRGAALVLSGLYLNAVAGAMLLTPPSFYQTKKPKERASSIYKHKEFDLGSKTDYETEMKAVSSYRNIYNPTSTVDLNQPYYTSTGSLNFMPYKDLHRKKSPEDDVPAPYDRSGKISSQDMVHAMFCCCITCKDHSGPKMWDWNLFKNAFFIIYAIGVCFGNAGYVDLFLFLPPYYKDIGITKRESVLLLSIGGGFDLFGRILGGWFSDLGLIRRHNIMSFCMGFTAIVLYITLYVPGFIAALIEMIVLGFTGGFYMSLFSIVIIDFLGLDMMPLAFGMATLLIGLFNTMIPGLLGEFLERSP